MPKDLEAASPGYEPHASPKDTEVKEHERTSENWPSIWLLLAISMPRMALNMSWSAQWAALGPYLQTMLPSFAVQLTQIIGPVTGILVGPSVGVFSDRSTNKFGRRRPFLVVAAFTSIVCWILMGYTREIGEALGDSGTGTADRKWTSVFTVFFYVWMDVTVNVVQTPSMLLVADFAGDRQTMGASLGQAWSTLGAILVAGYIEFIGPAYNSLHSFMAMLSAVMAVCVAVASFAAKEKPLDPNSRPKESTLKSVLNAFASIWYGIKALPSVLVVYSVMFFCICYGYTAYNGSKGQFFGLEVYDGSSEGADTCGDNCTEAQKDYNHGVSLAGGRADLLFNIVGYLFSWCLPFLVRKFGAKWVVTICCLPQAMLAVMAWSSNVTFDVFCVAVTAITQNAVFAMVTPLIIHMFGADQEIGVYVGALNSANCFGQLLNFSIGSALVETSFGYKLPVFLGGIMSFLGFLTAFFFLKVKMYSM